MTFLIEFLAACALFSLLVFLMSRDPVKTVFNYPPAIIERCRQLGLVDDSNRPVGPDRGTHCDTLTLLITKQTY
jgi:hypothetical protein